MRRSFDVVVVGGGVMGSSAALWLSRAGLKVAVVERDPTYSRSSSTLAAGGIRQQFSNKENVMLSQTSLGFLREGTLGVSLKDIMYKEHGYLMLSNTDGGAAVLKENTDLQQRLGASTQLLSPEQMKAYWPWLETEGIVAGSYGAKDEGWFDPALLLNGLKKQAKDDGASYITGSVDGLQLEGSKVVSCSVGTAEGTSLNLSCGHVINAAGTHAAAIAKMAGWDNLKVGPRKRYTFNVQSPGWSHTRDGAFLDSAPKPMPLLVDVTGAWIRPEGNGFICGIPPSNDINCDPADFDVMEDSDELWDIIWPALAERIHGFERARVVQRWTGHYEYNELDQNAIIGPHETCANLVYLNGFSGHGLQQSPAAGRAAAELILHGAYQTLDLSAMSPSRFAAKQLMFEKNVV